LNGWVTNERENSSLLSVLEAFTNVSGPPKFLRHRVAEPEEAMEALCVVDRCGKEVSKHPPPGVQVALEALLHKDDPTNSTRASYH